MGAVHSFRVGVGVGTLEQSAQCVLRAGELLRAGGFGEAAIDIEDVFWNPIFQDDWSMGTPNPSNDSLNPFCPSAFPWHADPLHPNRLNNGITSWIKSTAEKHG